MSADANPIDGGAVLNKSSGTDTSILAAAYTPTRDSVAVRITIALATGATDTTLLCDIAGATTETVNMDKASDALGLGQIKTFVMGCAAKTTGGAALTYTWKTGASTTVDYFLAEEIRSAVL